MADRDDFRSGADSGRSLAERAAERMAGEAARHRAPPAAIPSPSPIPAPPPPPRPQSSTPPPPRPQSSRPMSRQAPAARAVATIDQTGLHLAGYVTPRSDRTRVGEEFRIIKRPLLARAFAPVRDHGGRDRAIMVTSAHKGEGKTFTTINLAMSIATEPDVHVLLVDGDPLGHGLRERLGIQAERGLVDLLADESLDLADVLVRTDIPNLSIVPSGRIHPHAHELLASRRMATVFREIIQRYADRVILIDTPPVLASSEPAVIAMHAGQAVMVVEHARTSRRAVERSLALIGACPSIGFVLNRSTGRREDDYGGYDSSGPPAD
ncbi:MAG: XrtA-associated tyrosine autokinase [Alphaproteobacteria bacterium]